MSGITLHEVGGDLVIQVSGDSTVIGRGTFLQITDKRVSRSHALLEVIDGKLYITPTHTNPTFKRRENTEQRVLTRDVKEILNEGDEFGLLPENLFYKVVYPQINGKASSSDKSISEDNVKEETEDAVSNLSEKTNGTELAKKEDDEDDNKLDSKSPIDKKGTADKYGSEEDREEEGEESESKEVKSEKWSPKGSMVMPLEKKRPLPDWMSKAAASGSPVKKTSPKKPSSSALSKREPGIKITKAKPESDDEFLDEDDDRDIYKHKKTSRVRMKDDDSDDEFDDGDISDDDYVPEKPPPVVGKGKRKMRTSDSEEDELSDESDDEYSPSKKKSKAKQSRRTPSKKKGKGKKSQRAVRKTPQRSRSRRKPSDDEDDDDDEGFRRRPARGSLDDDDDALGRRPRARAAKAKRGSYVDDPMIEEALEDFASENDEDPADEKDSDFELDVAEDSGSDWDKKKKQKPKAPPRGPTKRATGSAKKVIRRRSKPDSDEEFYQDDEPYKPRPSKRRRGLVQDSDDEDSEGGKKKRPREKCQYGKKCYRKNPVHFRTFCHPGDESFSEEDEGVPAAKESRKEKTKEKPSRPQRSTAGTRLVTSGSVGDDDLPDTYDYDDSFIDDGTQPDSEPNDDNDSDYNADSDVKRLTKDAKNFIKNKKMLTPVGKQITPGD